MSTTMFIPMPEWQALTFLRDRAAAFERLLRPIEKKDRSEVSAFPDPDVKGEVKPPVLYAYKNRKDAIDVGYQAYPLTGFAMVRIVIRPLAYGNMVVRREVTGASGAYKLHLTGLNRICQKCACDDVEVMVDQIFPPCHAHPCADQAGCCKLQETSDDLRQPGPREVGMPSDDEIDD